MEFEILEDEGQATLLDNVRRFLQHPRRQMQAWGDNAPHLAAAAVFGLVVVEWVLSQRLANGLGRGPTAVNQAFGVAVAIFAVQNVVLSAASAMGALTGNAGHRSTGMAYLALGLAPFLLVLPATLLCETAGAPPALRAVLVLLLGIKVLGLWRAAIETTHGLSRMQSAAAIYISVGATVALTAVVVYAGLIIRLTAALS